MEGDTLVVLLLVCLIGTTFASSSISARDKILAPPVWSTPKLLNSGGQMDAGNSLDGRPQVATDRNGNWVLFANNFVIFCHWLKH